MKFLEDHYDHIAERESEGWIAITECGEIKLRAPRLDQIAEKVREQKLSQQVYIAHIGRPGRIHIGRPGHI